MKLREDRRNQAIVCALLICLAIDICLFFYLGLPMGDLSGQWKICAYTLRGYDPFELAITQEAPLENIGRIPSSFSTVPWACILGNVFYPGFLSLEGATIYIIVLQYIICAATVWIVHKRLKDGKLMNPVWLIALCIVSHFSLVYSQSLGNNGGIVSMLMIIAICLADDRPYASGVIIGIAMSKPQIAGIICVALLLNGKIKPLLVGAVIDIAGWVATAMVTSTPFMDLLAECLVAGTSSSRHYYGVLSPLALWGVDKMILLLMNAALGIFYTFCLWRYMKKHGQGSSVAAYAPACIASTIWTYKNGPDYMMVVFATVLFVAICLEKAVSMKDFLISLACILFLQMSRLGVNVLQVIFESYSVRTVIKSIEGLALMAIGFLFCKMWIKYMVDKKGYRQIPVA